MIISIIILLFYLFFLTFLLLFLFLFLLGFSLVLKFFFRVRILIGVRAAFFVIVGFNYFVGSLLPRLFVLLFRGLTFLIFLAAFSFLLRKMIFTVTIIIFFKGLWSCNRGLLIDRQVLRSYKFKGVLSVKLDEDIIIQFSIWLLRGIPNDIRSMHYAFTQSFILEYIFIRIRIIQLVSHYSFEQITVIVFSQIVLQRTSFIIKAFLEVGTAFF